MPKGYWIARVDIEDQERYQRYVIANGEVFKKYDARFLVRGGDATAVEGDRRERNVVIEFPSYQQALDCWNSPEYQEVRKLRTETSVGDLLVIEGHDG